VERWNWKRVGIGAVLALLVIAIGLAVRNTLINSAPTSPPTAIAAATAAPTSLPAATAAPTSLPAAIAAATAAPTTAVEAPTTAVEAPATAAAAVQAALPPDLNTIEIAVGVPSLSTNPSWRVKAQAIISSTQLAVDDYKGLLTISDLTIKRTKYEEDGSDAEANVNSALNVARKAVDNENVLCVVGHYNSGATRAAKSVYQPKSLAMITPSSSAVDVTDSLHTVWRLVGTDDDQGTLGAKFAAEVLKVTRAFIIYDSGSPNTLDAASAFRSQYRAAPFRGFIGKNIEANKYPPNSFDNDIRELDNQIKGGNKPEIIYFAGGFPFARIFLNALDQAGIRDIPILGIDTFDSPDLLKPPFVSFKVYATTMAQPLDVKQGREFAQKFATRYSVALQEIPGYSAEAYDATALCIQAITKAAQTVNGKPTREQVLEAMRNLTSTKVASQPSWRLYAGPYTFKQSSQANPGDLAEAAFYVRELSDGQLKTRYRWDRETQIWGPVP
jgi:branched-chain amino acid transport system substrate-binding protein